MNNNKFKFKNELILSFIIIIVALISFITIRSFITSGELEIEPFSLVIYAIFNYYLAIFFHEFGHMFFGIITGYQFVSFRLGSFVLYRDQTLKVGIEQVYGSPAHVVLDPPPLNKENRYPSYFYHLGGFIVNFFVVIIAIIFLNSINTMHKFLFSFFITLLVINLLTVLTNGVPFRFNGIPNDGYNLIHMQQDLDSYHGLYIAMKIQAQLTLGMSLQQIKPSDFKLLENAEIDKHYVVNALLYYVDALLYQEKFEEALQQLSAFEKHLADYDDITSVRIKKELSFLRILLNYQDQKIYLDDEAVLDDLKYSKQSLLNQRVLFIKEFVVKKDYDKALIHKQKAIELAQVHPLKSEADLELALIDYAEFNI